MRGLARGGAARYIKALAALALDVIADRLAGLRTPSQAPRMTTKWVNVEAIGSYFQSLSDPRHTRNRKLELAQALRFAVTLLLKRHPVKDSLRGKMIRCMMNTDFLTEVLTFQGD